MNLVSRVFFTTVVMSVVFTQLVFAQQFGRIPESERPLPVMQYDPGNAFLTAPEPASTSKHVQTPAMAPVAGDYGEPVLVGTMINAYTSSGLFSNQLGYDPDNNVVTIIFRAGPPETYPDEGNGMLVLNTTTDGGATWSGNSEVWNSDLQSNLEDYKYTARHPSIYSMSIEGTTTIVGLWSNIYATFLTPNGVYGEICHKAGPLGGPYQSGALPKETMLHYFPTKMTSDQNGVLYSTFQSINPDLDELTGDFYVLKSTDNGIKWSYPTEPCLTESELEDNYQIYYSSVNVDVSPDGNTLYVAFLGIYVEDGSFTFTDNRLGYIYSTDGGATWSDPVMYPLYTWDFGANSVNTLDGWMLPSVSVAVDGLGDAHFLMSVNGQDTFYPLDSMLIGEITVNPDDQSEPPTFYALAMNILPDFRRKINPDGATGAQPTFSIWAEHEWSKSPDGMRLVAKWIDADSLFVTTPDTHADPMVRDSTHDIFICEKNLNNLNNGAHGWNIDAVAGTHDIINVTNSVGVDEKFTKMNPRFNPETEYFYFLYTIMAAGEFVTGQIYPDTDDQAPAELWFVPWNTLVSSTDQVDAVADNMTLAQNYPNPFNPGTTIQFALPVAANVKLTICNLLGKEVATALDAYKEAGVHSVHFDASNLPSGQYFYRLEANGNTTSKIMTLMK